MQFDAALLTRRGPLKMAKAISVITYARYAAGSFFFLFIFLFFH